MCLERRHRAPSPCRTNHLNDVEFFVHRHLYQRRHGTHSTGQRVLRAALRLDVAGAQRRPVSPRAVVPTVAYLAS